MTLEEHIRYNKAVPTEMLEEVVESQKLLEHIGCIDAHLEEARFQYPNEDFLSGVISDLHELSRNLRGENKETLKGIIERLDDIAQCTFNAAEYGIDELNKALGIVAKAK